MTGWIKGAGVTEQDYVRQMPERVLPADFKLHASYIFRTLFIPTCRPPYAADIFVKMSKIKQAFNKPWDQTITLDLIDCDASEIWVRPISTAGFVVYPNLGVDKMADMPEGLHNIGYLLGKTALSDADLASLMYNSVPSDY